MNTSFERAAQKEEWLTPRFILDALASFDLDPCAPVVRPWPMAANHFTIQDNGLIKPWHGFVWCNPPYGQETKKWFRRMMQHGNGIALTFARTETKMFFECVWGGANAILFFKGRLKFWEHQCVCGLGISIHTPKYEKENLHGYQDAGTYCEGGSAGAPSVLIAYGRDAVRRIQKSKLEGKFIEL